MSGSTSFKVEGPFAVPFERRKGGRTLVFSDFWKDGSEAGHLAHERGCYVFAIQNQGSPQPLYVGKATKTFKQETFNDANKHKYHNGFSEYARGKPVMFFVVHPRSKGKTNGTYIAQIEDFLIQAGVAKNPNLQNVRGIQTPKWKIKGVVRGGAGKRTDAEVRFGNMFDIHR
ncbi:hypothetical protein [Lysobacter enzymogenes]|uniref:hypothetical protein n=1 Tax=Lysobacter enzymogenes TaxID=69 RepID=UPI0008957C78|nr:hypothetical protein [Lysobacter enzymogenes]SDY20379.1 hypothetical protein SAMN05421681_11393 [Lysobacter enzymogenes]